MRSALPYGLIFQNNFDNDDFGTDLIFDIDYFKWVHPAPPERVFSFWVIPCTLKFENTYALMIDIDHVGGMTDMLEVADLNLIAKIEEEANNGFMNG